MDTTTAPISKSLILSHRQCPRRAWLEARGAVAPEYSRAALMLQAQGHEVHESARSLFAGAKRISTALSLQTAADVTAKAIEDGTDQIIEAGFLSQGLGVRVDVLKRATKGWRIVEIKSGSGLKDAYLDDCAIQYHCATQSGLDVQGVDVMHPSTARARPAGGTGSEVFVTESVSDEVHFRAMAVPSWLAACRTTLAGDEPAVCPGEQCEDPHPCPFSGHCGVPAVNTDPDRVELLPSKAGAVGVHILAGAKTISELPADAFEHQRNALVRLAVVLGRAVVTEELARFLRDLPYPRHFVDFEAVSFPVPRFDGMRAYQAVPFQFSCHREDAPGAALAHTEFLDVSGNDPRRAFAERLIADVGTHGPVVVFSAYENTRIRELAVLFADLRDALMGIAARIVDLLPLARRGYYHPDMLGSWSLKKIAPTLPKVDGVADYDELGDVADGMEAQAAYLELTDPTLIGLDRQALRAKLLRYCGTDTAGLHRFTTTVQRALAQKVTTAPKARRVKERSTSAVTV